MMRMLVPCPLGIYDLPSSSRTEFKARQSASGKTLAPGKPGTNGMEAKQERGTLPLEIGSHLDTNGAVLVLVLEDHARSLVGSRVSRMDYEGT